jgi:hypothetical protein
MAAGKGQMCGRVVPAEVIEKLRNQGDTEPST